MKLTSLGGLNFAGSQTLLRSLLKLQLLEFRRDPARLVEPHFALLLAPQFRSLWVSL